MIHFCSLTVLLPVAVKSEVVGRLLRKYDAGLLTHPYKPEFTGDGSPGIATRPQQHPKTLKILELGMHQKRNGVGTIPADEEDSKKYGWLSRDERNALGTVDQILGKSASRQIARQIADGKIEDVKSPGMPLAPSPTQPPTPRPTTTQLPAVVRMRELMRDLRHHNPTPTTPRPQAPSPREFAHAAEPVKNGIRMCSVNQRLCADEALELYRIGNIVGILLDRYQVAWWATGGTLLGAVRNKGIIPHDNDLDYNILNDQAEILSSPSFIKDLKKNGLRKRIVERGFWQIKPVGKMSDIIHLDIFAMHRHLCSNQLCYPKHKWPKDTFPASLCPDDQPPERRCPALVRWPFGDSGSIWGPPEEMAQSYLNQVYGPDWHTPKCENTNHPCGLIQNMTHDATGRAEPSQNLIEPVFSKVAVNDL